MDKLFTESSALCVFGFPGSGTAITLMKLLHEYSKAGIVPFMGIYDQYHVGKVEQLKKIASMFDIRAIEFDVNVNSNDLPTALREMRTTGKKIITYLRGFSSVAKFHAYDVLFADDAIKKIFVLDCSRKDTINTAFLEEFYPGIHGVILSKRDMVEDFSLEALCEKNIPVLYTSTEEGLLDLQKGGV